MRRTFTPTGGDETVARGRNGLFRIAFVQADVVDGRPWVDIFSKTYASSGMAPVFFHLTPDDARSFGRLLVELADETQNGD